MGYVFSKIINNAWNGPCFEGNALWAESRLEVYLKRYDIASFEADHLKMKNVI
jgi:hypothetical protein